MLSKTELIWKSVKEDGYPKCNGEKIFVGINRSGVVGCFNNISLDTGTYLKTCYYITAEDELKVMDSLEYWAELKVEDVHES